MIRRASWLRRFLQQALTSAPILQGFLVVPYYAMVRFSEWDAILAEPAPSFDSSFTRAIWRYARAMAFVNRDRIVDAERELTELKALVAGSHPRRTGDVLVQHRRSDRADCAGGGRRRNRA